MTHCAAEDHLLKKMQRISDRLPCPPVLSLALFRKFLARVHAFTALGLEAQATAFSVEKNGVINLLAFLPQTNEVLRVIQRETTVVDGESVALPTEIDAFDRFRSLVPPNSDDTYVTRCWIHTHSRPKAFMSAVDLCQLYNLTFSNPDSFGIVISPREEGIKVLCVRLTEEGRNRIGVFYSEAQEKHVANVTAYVEHQIRTSFHTKFYCQISFKVTKDDCYTVDLRTKDEVVGQLQNFILSGDPDTCWLPPN